VGRHGDPSQLPDAMREKEKPNDRRPVEKTAFEGKFRG